MGYGLPIDVCLISLSPNGRHKQYKRHPPRDQNSALIIKCNNEIPASSSQMTEVIIESPSVMTSEEAGNGANEVADEQERLYVIT